MQTQQLNNDSIIRVYGYPPLPGHVSNGPCGCGYTHLDTTPPYPWINYEVPLIDPKPKLEVEVWHQCPACKKDFVTTFKNPTQKDFDNISEHLNKDIPLCQECGCYYDE